MPVSEELSPHTPFERNGGTCCEVSSPLTFVVVERGINKESYVKNKTHNVMGTDKNDEG